jgi:hypothetical protein
MSRDQDEIAIERYRYLLRTAPPEEIERAHAEAFAALTPEQRRKVIEGLASAVPEEEVAAAGDDPQRLARVATRAEMRDPGTLERVYGRMPAGGGFLGGLGFGGMFLSTLAGAFIGTAIADSLFNDVGYPPGDPAADSATPAGDAETDTDTGTEASSDSAGTGWDDGGGDAGDFGGGDSGDIGGGDIGGGDIGGGDFGDFGGDMGGGFDI